MTQTKKQPSLFDSFTNLYSLSKTLRFELKPTPETEELLKKTNLQGKTPVQVDQEIDELYHKEMKPLFDELHEKFINEALAKVTFEITDLEQLEKKYLELKSLNRDRKNNSAKIKKLTDNRTGEIPKLENRLREIIVEQFDKLGEVWKEKYNKINLDDAGYKILTNSNILDVLLILYPEKSESIKKFQGFFTYFSGFNQNRENYYTVEDKATGIANQTINTNLPIFLDNKQKIEEILGEAQDLKAYKKYFELGNYQNYLIQKNIDDFNEEIIGKINSEKNLFCQQENTKIENKDKKIYLPNLKKLHKQIGCRTKQQREQEESGKSIYPEYLEKVGLGFQITKNDQGKYHIWEALGYITEELRPKLKKLKENYQKFFNNWQEYRLDEIWFRKESINTISGRWFGGDNWAILTKALAYSGTGKIEKGEYKIPSFVGLQELRKAMEALEAGINFDIKKSKRKNNPETSIKEAKKFSYTAENIFKNDYKAYFKENLFETLLAIWQNEIDSKFKQIFNGYEDKEGKTFKAFLKEFEEKSKEPFNKNKKDATGKSVHMEAVKNLIEEGYLRLFQLTKYHNLEKKGEVDARATENRFYDVLNEFWEENAIVTYHKAFQSTLTKKPFSEEKIRLNFERGNLFTGWSDDKENDHTYQYGSTFVKMHDKYFVAVIIANDALSLKKNPDVYDTTDNSCQLMASKLLKSTTIYGSSYMGKYKSDYKTDKGNMSSEALIDRVKAILRDKIITFPELQIVIDEEYKDSNALAIRLGEKDFFTPNFVNIKEQFIKKLQEQGKIYLFEITNQNLTAKSKTLNLHTLYFNYLFSEKNLKTGILKLDANAKIFFRKASISKKIDVHRSKTFDIIENRRYTKDKYLFYFPVKINFTKPKSKAKELNLNIREKIQSHQYNIKIIGIDRGEKNLLYYSVVDSKGKMIDQESLNVINKVDYNSKLQERQDKRKQARLDWEEIGNIKNFKEGYLSQAVNKIYELIIKHNAIVVMEDLNSEFKAKRMAKVEKSVYKKFELALARKLNHLILKEKKPDDLGGVLNAYQLTPYIDAGKVGDFEKAKQWGILFYVRANYTSTTDPLTGWRKHLYVSNSETDAKIQEFFKPDDGVQINYDLNKKCFKFSYLTDSGKAWKLSVFEGLQRFYWDNKNRKIKTYNLHRKFEELFSNLDKSKNINLQIYGRDFKWKTLIFLWNLLNQIRNTDKVKSGNENDFLQSPIWSEKHKQFFDSRKVTSKDIPNNGDANGAYNIARKGVILMGRIINCEDSSKFGNDNNGKNPDNGYYISDPYWDKWAVENSSR